MTITLGWWAIPAAMTAALIVWGFFPARSSTTDYGRIGEAVVQLVYLLFGIIVCLIVWLTWAVLS